MYIYNQHKSKSTINLDGAEVKPPASLSFNYLTTNRLPVWIINNTRPKGKVILQMTLPNGKTKPVFVERTNLPVCVTDEVGQEMVENGSQDLRAYINKGILSLMWPADALEVVGTTEAQEEIARLRSSEFSANSTFVSQRVDDMNKITPTGDTTLQAGSVLANEISPRIMDFVARFNSNDVQVKDAVGELKVMEDELTGKDLSYVIANIPNGKAKKYAQNLLANRQTQPAAPSNVPTGKNNEYDIRSDDNDLTPEERAAEAARAATARQFQKI